MVAAGSRSELGLLLLLFSTPALMAQAPGDSPTSPGVGPIVAYPAAADSGPASKPTRTREKEQAIPPLSVSDEAELVSELIRVRSFKAAETRAREFLLQVERRSGPESPAATDALDLLVEALRSGGQSCSPETRRLAERALHTREKLPGPELDLLPSLVNLAGVLKDMSDYAGAKPLLERALKLHTLQLGPESPPVADDLTALGIVLRQLADYAQAKRCFERALAIRERHFGPEDVRVATTLTHLAIVLADLGEDERARELCTRAFRIREQTLGPEDPTVAQSLNTLAILHLNHGEYEEARRLHERALAIRERVFGPDDVRVAESLSNLASLLSDIGDYDAARPLCERALAIRTRAFGPEHDLVGSSLLNLGNLLRSTGEYAGALSRYQQALAIYERALGRSHPRVATDLMLLAGLEHEMGADEEARQHYERALAIRRQALGPKHRDVAECLQALGRFLLDTGKPVAARPLLEEALAIREPALGADHPDLGVCRTDLAEDLGALGEPRRARKLYDEALRAVEKAYGPRHDAVAACLRSFGDFLFQVGDRAAARRSYERALSIDTDALGPEHPEVGQLWERIAWLDLDLTDPTGALTAALEAERIGREHLRLTSRTLTEGSARRYAAVRSAGLSLALSLAVSRAARVPLTTERVWDAMIRSRALLLDEMAARHRTIEEAGNPEVARLAHTLAESRRRLANLTLRGIGSDRPERYRSLLDEARSSREKAEQELAEKSFAFRREQARATAGFSEVAHALPAGSALIAYARYEDSRMGPSGSRLSVSTSGFVPPGVVGLSSYVAFVLPGIGREPLLVSLGEAQTIDTLVVRWSVEVASGPRRHGADAERYYREAGTRLRQAIWDPLAPYLGAANYVFIVPDGALQIVSFAVLPVGEAQYLVEAGPLLHYLSAERDLLRPDEQAPMQPGRTVGMLVVGGPDFDSTNQLASLGAVAFKGADLSVSEPRSDRTDEARDGSAQVTGTHPYRGERPDCGDFAAVRFRQLPGAAHEAEDIAGIWDRAQRRGAAGKGRVSCRQLTGASASEAAFKQLAPGKEIIHLATHGFFLGGSCSASSSEERGVQGLRPLSTPGAGSSPSNPLLLAGLALAGANRRAQARPEDEDGILTAEEIASLNLEGVRWAVLSGCDTGIGEIAVGEGVFGLRRAFEIAGAGTVIMSLWPVRDNDVRQWMHSLYDNRLLRHLGTAESVQAAAIDMLQLERQRGQPTHPACWGGFVAAGNWR